MNRFTPTTPALTDEDRAEILHFLEQAGVVFERSRAPLAGHEIRAKSILGALRKELRAGLPPGGVSRPEPPLVVEKDLPPHGGH